MSSRTRLMLLAALLSVAFFGANSLVRTQEGWPRQDDITFPKDWNKRKPPCGKQQLTDSERKLLKALAAPLDIDLPDSTLEDVLTYLQDKTGATIVLPLTILDDQHITAKAPVSISLKAVTLRTILRKVLGQFDLTYIIEKAEIQVTTQERAKKSLTNRTYPIGDLLGVTGKRLDSAANQAKWKEAADDLINVIVTTVEPQSWSVKGGPGEIKFEPSTKSLVIRQTTEVHLLLGSSLASNATPDKDKSSDSSTKKVETLSTQELVEALRMPLDIEMEDSTLEDVLKYLKEKTGVTIVVAQVVLDENVVKPKAPVSITLKGVMLSTVLKKLMSQLTAEELDYAIRPPRIVITKAHLAAHVWEYAVRDLIEQMPQLLPYLQRWYGAELFQDLSPTDRSALLIRVLTNPVELRSWETIELRNKSRLVVLTSPTRHEEINDALKSLRRLLDDDVVMNARLYEVDRAFYAKHIAPLFPADKDATVRPIVVRIEAPLLKAISQQKLVLESDEMKLRTAEETSFLSKQTVFRYAAGPDPKNDGRTLTGSGLAGVSFEVRPLISPDRRFLRLQISQQVVQLVGIEKTTKLDLSTGKEVTIEVPTVRNNTLTGTVQIPDTGPILMPVDYRPPGKDSKDKVWLLVARPYIWIKEEEDERGKPIPQADIWDSVVPKDETPAPVTPLPSDEKTKAILQAVLKDVLTNPDLKDFRETFGTPKDKTFTLIAGDKLGWPKKFHPDMPGFKLVEVKLDPFVDQNRVLGIRLDHFDLEQKDRRLFDEPIVVCLFNAGGHANPGGADNGGFVYYKPKRVGHRWIVQYCGADAQ